MDVPVLDEHPRKIRAAEVRADSTLEESQGWVDMAVQWIVTRHTVGAERTVFGITTIPPGGRHDIHRHPNRRRSSTWFRARRWPALTTSTYACEQAT